MTTQEFLEKIQRVYMRSDCESCYIRNAPCDNHKMPERADPYYTHTTHIGGCACSLDTYVNIKPRNDGGCAVDLQYRVSLATVKK